MDVNSLFHTFIPLFVAIDVFGVIPVFVSLTEGLPSSRKNTLITQATVTALAVSVVFLVAGRAIFRYLGITEYDFRVGGGVVLLVLAVVDLVFTGDIRHRPLESVGVVPIGIPLIVGPAVLTTILILVDAFGTLPTIVSLLANLVIVWLAFRYSALIGKVLGATASRAVAKVASLFMVAIAVMMIRGGLTAMLAGKVQ